MYDVESLRRNEFPLSQETAYLNHAAVSPLPARTRRRMQSALEQMATRPTGYFHDEYKPLTESLLERLARFINAADATELMLTTTTSAGLNAVAQALPLRPGDNILFADQEFPANAYPWMSLARDGIEIRMVPAQDGGLTLERIAPLVNERTRLVAASAIQFFSGHRTDLTAIGDFCRPRGILFAVDAIQAIGHLPIDVRAMNIDILASGGQKSILGPPGIGFLYVRNPVCSTLAPRSIGPNSTQNFEHWLAYDPTPLPGAARFKLGTANVLGAVGLDASLSLVMELNVADIDRYVATLSAQAIEQLVAAGYLVVTPAGRHGPIVTFRTGLDRAANDALVDHLRQQGVVVGPHLDREGRAHIRLSFHGYNSVADLDRFWAGLRLRPMTASLRG